MVQSPCFLPNDSFLGDVVTGRWREHCWEGLAFTILNAGLYAERVHHICRWMIYHLILVKPQKAKNIYIIVFQYSHEQLGNKKHLRTNVTKWY